jgi:short-subunit dehydrogenase
VAGVRGCRWSPSYGASKAFVANYLEALRARARHDRLPVVVTEIVPGFVDTPMIAGRTDLFWVADADTAARQTYRAIRAGKPRAYVTRRWTLVAWLLRHLPDRVLERL